MTEAKELQGVITELVEAYSRLVMRGDFEVPAPVKRATEKVLRAAHPLKQFISELCVVGPGRYVSRPYFKQRLRFWCSEEKNNWEPSAQLLTEEMELLGFPVGNKRDSRTGHRIDAFIGLSLKDSPMIEAVLRRQAPDPEDSIDGCAGKYGEPVDDNQ